MKSVRMFVGNVVRGALFALMVVLLAVAFAQPAFAQGKSDEHRKGGGAAPEIDPNAVAGALAVLSGGLLLVTDRFRAARSQK